MSTLQSFDVHRAGMIGGTAIGAFLVTITAKSHAAAREHAEEVLYPECAVVVLPHRTPTAKLERALTQLDRLVARRASRMTRGDRSSSRRGGQTSHAAALQRVPREEEGC